MVRAEVTGPIGHSASGGARSSGGGKHASYDVDTITRGDMCAVAEAHPPTHITCSHHPLTHPSTSLIHTHGPQNRPPNACIVAGFQQPHRLERAKCLYRGGFSTAAPTGATPAPLAPPTHSVTQQHHSHHTAPHYHHSTAHHHSTTLPPPHNHNTPHHTTDTTPRTPCTHPATQQLAESARPCPQQRGTARETRARCTEAAEPVRPWQCCTRLLMQRI